MRSLSIPVCARYFLRNSPFSFWEKAKQGMKFSSLLQCTNLAEVQKLLSDTAGDVDGLNAQLERIVLGLRKAPESCASSQTMATLQLVRSVTSLGGEISRECSKCGLPTLLTRFVSTAAMHCSEEDGYEEAIAVASAALSNCSGETARHMNDMYFTIKSEEETVMQVRFGFADYTSAETAARLWAGAVSLTLVMRERFVREIVPRLLQCRADNDATSLRVAEIGCGPGLASVALVEILKSADIDQMSPLMSLALDTTDISQHAVNEVTKSVRHRNSATPIPQWVSFDSFPLDFSSVPASLAAAYDLIIASDIVYDFKIAKMVPPALIHLLKRDSGIALICCESHRDAMCTFAATITAEFGEMLELQGVERPVRLVEHSLPVSVNPDCTLFTIRRR